MSALRREGNRATAVAAAVDLLRGRGWIFGSPGGAFQASGVLAGASEDSSPGHTLSVFQLEGHETRVRCHFSPTNSKPR